MYSCIVISLQHSSKLHQSYYSAHNLKSNCVFRMGFHMGTMDYPFIISSILCSSKLDWDNHFISLHANHYVDQENEALVYSKSHSHQSLKYFNKWRFWWMGRIWSVYYTNDGTSNVRRRAPMTMSPLEESSEKQVFYFWLCAP